MSEFIHSRDSSESKADAESERRYPTEEELRDFEAHREYERAMHVSAVPYAIEDIARDPENPTEEELETAEVLSRSFGPILTSFEEYFGYPDPREKPPAMPGDQPASSADEHE